MKKRERKNSKFFLEFFIRYLILIIIAIPNLWIFYLIFTPLTLLTVSLSLKLFFDLSVIGNTIFISKIFSIEIIRACVAGSAYYLLLILNLSTPKIKSDKRIKIILFCFLSFFIVNVLRIVALSAMYVNGVTWFDFAHLFSWYFGSIILVIGIWFLSVKLFKIKEIPFYSDLTYFYKLMKKH